MADKRKIIIPVVLSVIIIGTALFLIFRDKGDKKVVSGTGTIEATEVDVSLKLSGKILEMEVGEGEKVEEGDLLAVVKATEIQARRIGAAALFNEAEINLGRAKSLYRAGGISKMDLDSAESAYLQAKSSLEYIDATLVDTKLYAPISGVVTSKNLEVGETAFPGVALLTLADLRLVWMKIYVAEPVMGLINLGDEARVMVDSYPSRTFSGKVTYISQEPEFTPKNVQTQEERTKLVFAVKIELKNDDLALKPGMPADAEILLSGNK
ncbi:MAG: efflux RND transporter periplasmic adaptor subunit [Deltaproteobacteria bacterium]|uniref:Efflux RND transporter periplasmic adaptor subunit n=1 Tax=Candidatus Zymogenus saltonus TaxID=2844893 RepID=A0A9D8KF64_9DELT|nr:efflux RND transporter periplasmic adaptor subunit [Candidatus Zymogenus saltonus]